MTMTSFAITVYGQTPSFGAGQRIVSDISVVRSGSGSPYNPPISLTGTRPKPTR